MSVIGNGSGIASFQQANLVTVGIGPGIADIAQTTAAAVGDGSSKSLNFAILRFHRRSLTMNPLALAQPEQEDPTMTPNEAEYFRSIGRLEAQVASLTSAIGELKLKVDSVDAAYGYD